MAGQSRYIDSNKRNGTDPNQLSTIKNMASTITAQSVTGSRDNIKQYVKTKNGIFNGAFGSIAQSLDIATGILNLSSNSSGPVVPRRVVHINPETGVTDTLIGIETVGTELTYQELILVGVAGDTITITHNSGGVSGTEKPILCPGDTDYTLSGDEVSYLIYDTSITSWLITGGTGGGGSSEVFTWTAPHNADGNILTLDTAATTSIDGATANTITLKTNSSTRMSITDVGTIVVGTFDTWGNTTIGNASTDLLTLNAKLNSDIDMDGNNLVLDADNDTYINSFSDDTIQFVTNSSLRMSISNSAITLVPNTGILGNLQVDGSTILGDTSSDTIVFNGVMASTIKMEGNLIYLDSDEDTNINSTSDDIILLVTGGSTRMSLTNTGIIVASPITMLLADIEMDDNDLDFGTGGTIDFHDVDGTSKSSGAAAALPALPTSYFKVKYRGNTRYIPYYSA
jgi:hypothetical protein